MAPGVTILNDTQPSPDNSHQQLCQRFLSHAAAAFDLLFDQRDQEQLLTFDQRQLRACELGREWLAGRDADVQAFRNNQATADYAPPPPVATVSVDGGRVPTRQEDGVRGVRDPGWRVVGGFLGILDFLHSGCSDEDARKVVADGLGYVANNRSRMDHPRYRRLGLPISSAAVESVMKQVNRRMKGTEKFWLEGGAEALLQVCVANLSEDGRAERYGSCPRPHAPAVGGN